MTLQQTRHQFQLTLINTSKTAAIDTSPECTRTPQSISEPPEHFPEPPEQPSRASDTSHPSAHSLGQVHIHTTDTRLYTTSLDKNKIHLASHLIIPGIPKVIYTPSQQGYIKCKCSIKISTMY